MSVLIKGFKIPENCIKCPMQFGGFCYVAPPEIDERVAPTVDEAWEQGKPEWCPLVEVVTPHDDLIERPSEFLIKKCSKQLLLEYFKKIPAWVEKEGDTDA